MPVERALSIVVPVIKGKGDIRNCSFHRAMKLFVHGIKVVERVLERKLHRIVTFNKMQFDLLYERETIDEKAARRASC